MESLARLVTGNPVLSALLLALPILAIPATAGSELIRKEGIRKVVIVLIWTAAAFSLVLFLYAFSLVGLNQ